MTIIVCVFKMYINHLFFDPEVYFILSNIVFCIEYLKCLIITDVHLKEIFADATNKTLYMI